MSEIFNPATMHPASIILQNKFTYGNSNFLIILAFIVFITLIYLKRINLNFYKN